MSDSCFRHRVTIGGENYYLTVGDDFVMCTVPRENDPYMSNTREVVETLCDEITATMQRRNGECQI